MMTPMNPAGIAATIYEQHASLDAEGVQTCIGDPCFRATFLILAFLSFLGAALAIGLGKYIGASRRHVYALDAASERHGPAPASSVLRCTARRALCLTVRSP